MSERRLYLCVCGAVKNASPGPRRSSTARQVPGGQADRPEKTAAGTKPPQSDRKGARTLASQNRE